MTLEMRPACERCGTFCADCGEALEHVCPNCGGELVARPKRASA